MASRTLPNLGLKAFWPLGEDGYKDEMDLDFLSLSVLTQAGAISKVAATPGSPAAGDVHLFDETHPTQANKVAVYDDGAWKYFTPLVGWMVYNRAAGYFEVFDGTVWAEMATGGGGGGAVPPEVVTEAGSYTLAAADQGKYTRLTGAAAKTINISLEATTALPDNGEWHFRNAGAGAATVTPAAGVTVAVPAGGTLAIPNGGTVTLKRVAADAFDLFGQVVAV